MGLRTYILKRAVYSFALLLFVLVLNFVIFDLMPGDPTALFANQARLGGVETALAMEQLWGLNEPVHVRFVVYMRNMLTGQFGISYISLRPIANEDGDRLLHDGMCLIQF